MIFRNGRALPPRSSALRLLAAVCCPNSTSTQKRTSNIGGVNVFINFALSLPFPPVTLDSTGATIYKFTIPKSSSLIGANAVFQAFIVDKGGAPNGFSATQGLDLHVASHGLLIGSRSTGKASPQIAINLDTGKQSSFAHASLTNNGIPGFQPGSRAHLLMGSGLSDKVVLMDCRVFLTTECW